MFCINRCQLTKPSDWPPSVAPEGNTAQPRQSARSGVKHRARMAARAVQAKGRGKAQPPRMVPPPAMGASRASRRPVEPELPDEKPPWRRRRVNKCDCFFVLHWE